MGDRNLFMELRPVSKDRCSHTSLSPIGDFLRSTKLRRSLAHQLNHSFLVNTGNNRLPGCRSRQGRRPVLRPTKAAGIGAASPNQRTNQHGNPAKQPRAGRKHGSDDMIAAAASGVGKQREAEGSQEEGRKRNMVLIRVTAPPAREGNPCRAANPSGGKLGICYRPQFLCRS
jgi:hypothetical protein